MKNKIILFVIYVSGVIACYPCSKYSISKQVKNQGKPWTICNRNTIIVASVLSSWVGVLAAGFIHLIDNVDCEKPSSF